MEEGLMGMLNRGLILRRIMMKLTEDDEKLNDKAIIDGSLVHSAIMLRGWAKYIN